MSEYALDAIVIGAGVVGLAIGRALSITGRSVAVLDRNDQFGMETSSRNSEVVHAGIYYPPHSLKARLCVEGRRMLYDYALRCGVAYRQCGKLIVGSGAGAEAGIEHILVRGAANGVSSLVRISVTDLGEMEPLVKADYALHSPDTGIIDSHQLMTAYLADLEDQGGLFVPRSDVRRVIALDDGFDVLIGDDRQPVRARYVVNAAGLFSGDMAQRIEGLASEFCPTIHYARGLYFALAGSQKPFSRLIYPLPDTASLGVHATIDLGGGVRFGPDVEWISDPNDYRVEPNRAVSFEASIRKYWPGLRADGLVPDYAGIRPKLVGPGDPAADFRVDGPLDHGVPGLCCLHGIESPGLTASLAIADYVVTDILNL